MHRHGSFDGHAAASRRLRRALCRSRRGWRRHWRRRLTQHEVPKRRRAREEDEERGEDGAEHGALRRGHGNRRLGGRRRRDLRARPRHDRVQARRQRGKLVQVLTAPGEQTLDEAADLAVRQVAAAGVNEGLEVVLHLRGVRVALLGLLRQRPRDDPLERFGVALA